MAGSRLGDGLTLEQLLHVLRERIVSILLNKSPEVTLDEAQTYTQRIEDILIRARCLENSFQTAVRVPPDVLCAISSHLDEEDLFSASQVCHYWRSVLTSSPFLWTHINCRRAPRTLASLERCKFLPIQLRLESAFSATALKSVLLHGGKISSLTTTHQPWRIAFLRQIFSSSRHTLEQLHICAERREVWGAGEDPVHNIWNHLPSLRDLLVYQNPTPIGRLGAPNIVHLAIERVVHQRAVTIQAVLDTLRGCPLLETLLFSHSGVIPEASSPDHSPVSLPRLRSIELGEDEVHSGLITFLQLPQKIAVGFRMIQQKHLYNDTPPTLISSIQHVLERIDIRSITLAAPLTYLHTELLIHFEGLGGSFEITTDGKCFPARPRLALLALEGILSSPLPGVENVKELHIVGCSFDSTQGSRHINAALRNIVSISFFHCDDSQVFKLLTQTYDSLPSFPYLECVMILGRGSKMEQVARRRKGLGVPLKTIVLGQGSKGFEYNHPKDYTVLRGLVDDLRVGCPTEILEWGAENDVLITWSQTRVPDILADVRKAFKFCRFNVSG